MRFQGVFFGLQTHSTAPSGPVQTSEGFKSDRGCVSGPSEPFQSVTSVVWSANYQKNLPTLYALKANLRPLFELWRPLLSLLQSLSGSYMSYEALSTFCRMPRVHPRLVNHSLPGKTCDYRSDFRHYIRRNSAVFF